MKNSIKILLGLALTMLGTQAQSLVMIQASSCTGDATEYTAGYLCWQGSEPNNPSVDDFFTITGLSLSLDLMYKDNVGGIEEGLLTGSYDTTFSNTALDPENALITYTGGDMVSCPECYLLVKDGNHDPIWYLFDIGYWDGEMDIDLQNFWPDQGAISHVSIWSGEGGTTVPEPGVLALLSIGLIGLGLRKKLKAS